MSEKIYNAAGEELNVANSRIPLPTDTVLATNYINVLKSSWNSFLSETNGNYNRIPIIVHTDQHINRSIAADVDDFYAVMNAIDANCDWNKISKIINLGDFCALGILEKTNLWLPSDKVINVPGNHDLSGKGADHTTVMDCFTCGGNARQFNKNEWWAITDDLHNVKYLVVNDFESDTAAYWYQSAEQIEWIVSELEKADGYDVILCSHCFFGDGTSTAYMRNGSIYNRIISLNPWSKDETANASWHTLLAARKNKTSGTYTDSDGHSIAYDFTNCDSELLIALHGHDHRESYENLTNSIMSYAFECFHQSFPSQDYGCTFYFAYIDRVAKKFKNWKLYDGITRVDVQEIDIN